MYHPLFTSLSLSAVLAAGPPLTQAPRGAHDVAAFNIALKTTLANPGGMSGQQFGGSVAILGDRAVVGAPNHQTNIGRAW